MLAGIVIYQKYPKIYFMIFWDIVGYLRYVQDIVGYLRYALWGVGWGNGAPQIPAPN